MGGGDCKAYLAEDKGVEEGAHVDGAGLGVLGEAVEHVEDVLADVVAAVDGNGVADDDALVAGERRVRERADEDPGEEADVVDAVDKLLGALLVVRGQVAQPGQVLDDAAVVAVLALVELGELERQELGQAGLQLRAQRVHVAAARLQALVGLQVALHPVDRVDVGDELDDLGDVLLQAIGHVDLDLDSAQTSSKHTALERQHF